MIEYGESRWKGAEVDEEAVLAKKLRRLFSSASERQQVEALLARYGTAPHEQEAARVRLAIIKLARSDRDKLEMLVAAAKEDFRDVLAAAEYPIQMKGDGWRLSDAERAPLIQQDREQYERWLEQDEE